MPAGRTHTFHENLVQCECVCVIGQAEGAWDREIIEAEILSAVFIHDTQKTNAWHIMHIQISTY